MTTVSYAVSRAAGGARFGEDLRGLDGAAASANGHREEPWLLFALLVNFSALLWLAACQPFDLGYRKPAELAAGMLASGNWVIQRYADGRLYFDKPPLLTWVVAGVARFTSGPLSWEQHVPGLLAWVLTLSWTGLLARHWFETRRAGLIAALVLATTFGFPTLIRTKRLDPIFAALTTGAVYYGYHALVAAGAPARRTGLTLASWLFTALAILTKGPLALVFALGPIVLFAGWTRRLRSLASRANLVGALLCGALVLAWPLFLLEDLGVAKALAKLRGTNLATRKGGHFFYLTNAPLRLLPWVLLVPALVGWRGGEKQQRASDAVRLAVCWVLAVLVPLQFSSAKHYRYLLPAFPAFAFLVTALVHDEALGGWGRRCRDWGIGLVLALLLVAAAASPIATGVVGARSPIGPGLATALALVVGTCAWLGLVALRRGQTLRAFALALCATSLAYAVEIGALALIYAGRDPTAVVESAFVDPIQAGVDARTYDLDRKGRGLALIATRRLIPHEPELEALVAWLRTQPSGRGVLMTSPAGAARLEGESHLAVSRRSEAELDGDPFVFLELTLSN